MAKRDEGGHKKIHSKLTKIEELEEDTNEMVQNIEEKLILDAGKLKEVAKGKVNGFFDFIREQGVVGLAVGVVIGVAVKDTVDKVVAGFINPLIEIVLPSGDALEVAKFSLFGSDFLYGSVISSLINLLAVAAVIYFVLKGIGLDKLDKKKDSK